MYVCALYVSVWCVLALRIRAVTQKPTDPEAARQQLYNCAMHMLSGVCVSVWDRKGVCREEGHRISVSGRVCVYYFVFCAHKLSCDRQWKLQKRRRLTARARCGCIRHATAPVRLPLPLSPLVLVNLRSRAVATMYVCVCVILIAIVCVVMQQK